MYTQETARISYEASYVALRLGKTLVDRISDYKCEFKMDKLFVKDHQHNDGEFHTIVKYDDQIVLEDKTGDVTYNENKTGIDELRKWYLAAIEATTKARIIENRLLRLDKKNPERMHFNQ